MGKPLENFARGIAEAVREFCSAKACPVLKSEESGGEVENITPETAPALIKHFALELGKDFSLEGNADDGTYLSVRVENGNLKEIRVREGMRESVIETNVPVLEIGSELFEGFPLNKRFRIKARRL